MRARRAAPETGAFGKSTRRSRSKTATPARREDPTIQSAHKVFAAFFQQQSSQTEDATEDPSSATRQRRSSAASTLLPPTTDLSDEAAAAAAAQPTAPRAVPKVPTEVILRGFKSTDQQYAAINHYEQVAGRICEDYPRDPPFEIRRYKSDLRDPAFSRRRPLTPDERQRVNRADSGAHWVKVTFDSSQAADAAVFSSPQAVLGHLVYAEPYRGLPPLRDEAVPDATTTALLGDEIPSGWRRPGRGGNRTAGELRTPFAGGAGGGVLPHEVVAGDEAVGMGMDLSPPHSQTSSRTVESGTVNGSSSSSNTVTGPTHPGAAAAAALPAPAPAPAESSVYCRRIPTARKAVLLPAEQALLPSQTYAQRILGGIPFLTWFSGSMIGNEVPRTAEGEFDWVNASLYWKLICWLDWMFSLFGGEVVYADKDD